MKAFLTLVFCLIVLSSFAQDTEKHIDFKNAISFDLLPIFAQDGVRYRIGYIHSVNQKIKLGLNLGYGNVNNLTFYSLDNNSEYELFEIRPQFFYRINKLSQKNAIYTSIELTYINHNQIVFNDFYTDENNLNVFYERTNFERNKFEFLFHIGAYQPLGKSNFGFNPHIGLGIRHRTNTFSNTILDQDNFNDDRDGFLFSNGLFNDAGVKIGFTLTFGAKFYYTF